MIDQPRVAARLMTVVELQGMSLDAERVAKAIVRLLTPEIMRIIGEQRREERSLARPKNE